MYIIFDVETTGLPHNKAAPVSDLENWPRMVQLAWQLHESSGKLVSNNSLIIKPEGFTIPYNAEKIHGITTDRANKEGLDLSEVLSIFLKDLDNATLIAGHNIEFDLKILGAELLRKNIDRDIFEYESEDTMDISKEYCGLEGGMGGKLKPPKLGELYKILFGKELESAHDAAYDVHATAKCFFELIKKNVYIPEGAHPDAVDYESPQLGDDNFAKTDKKEDTGLIKDEEAGKEIESPFFHLHVHSQYSVLQATPNIRDLVTMAKDYNMPAVALTDLGNMFGVFQFVREALKNDLKPIVGCEFFVAEERKKLKFTKDNPDKRFNQILLAKNKAGYKNLTKLSSIAYMEGLYGLYPRIDKELITEYKDNLIALTGSVSSEIPYLILNVGEHQAEEAFQWWLETFKDDFYIELLRHGREEENRVNEVLLDFAKKYGVKVIAANNVFYLNKEDSNAHDVLLCIKEGEFQSTPIGRGRGYRFGFDSNEYYFKSQEEMKALFSDIPEAVENLSHLLEKIEVFKLESEVLLPKFKIPENFIDPEDEKDGGKRGENKYLKHLAFEGAVKRYGEVTKDIEDRLNFELETIENTGYPGYFLIVQDFTARAREMDVAVGPGRGSAAGSVVAYCIGITNIDPIGYNLLFERFLNPDRVSLPDIDIDFDDEGRDKVIQYVIDKYGYNQVSQIITYGTMAAKSSIRDSGRVMELSLAETNDLAKLVPDRVGTTLAKAFKEIRELEEIRKQSDVKGNVLKQAVVLEGSVRNTGTHACGVIIAPDDLTQYIPVCTSKDSNLLITQYDNSVIEDAGMLKMDFLGLKTLSIIKTAIKNIKKSRGVTIDIDTLPLDDEETYKLYQEGHTNGTFQFESAGMQKYLRGLKPDKFEDLIAMNALYRPGPMEYIPNFIARKHGKEEITYDLPEMEEFLSETYGITVYQEQVMLLSQKLAGFSKGDADVLRKAMGKKIKALIDKIKPKFIEGCHTNGHPEDVAEKVWKDWEAFASYAFNKSHSTCYSLIAYQTAYLKAHYPAEYMAAVLTHNQNNIEKVSFFMEECRDQGIPVLGPHVNESGVFFEVNSEGKIRFGLGAIKGTGEAAVDSIIEEREKNGPFKNIFEFSERMNLRSVNKKTFEALAMSGAFDCFKEFHRKQYLEAPEGDVSLVEKIIKHANNVQAEKMSSQASLFGGSNGLEIPKPTVKPMEPYGDIEKLKIEKEVVGLYISGHPLDNFSLEMKHFCNAELKILDKIEELEGKELKFGGIVSGFAHRITKNGKPFGTLSVEDYNGNHTFFFFGDDYVKFKEYMMAGWFLYIQGRVERRKWGEQRLEFKVNNIGLLSELREKNTTGLNISINLDELNPAIITKLETLLSENKGDKEVTLRINTQKDRKPVSAELRSRKFLVDPSNELLKKMDKIPEIEYSIV